MMKHYTSKNLLTEFLYPLLNIGYIDSIPSLIDRRAYIYFPVLDVTNEKSINLFLLDKKNNLFQNNQSNNVNHTLNTNKIHIISKIKEVMRYYSEDNNSVTLRIADEDTTTDSIEEKEEQNEDKEVEEIFEKYYSKFSLENNNDDQNDMTAKDLNVAASGSTCGEEYLQKTENNNNLQNIQTNDATNSNNDPELSNKLFHNEEKNKIIYPCYRCEFEGESKIEYETHCVLIHPNKPGYPTLADIHKDGLTTQGKSWE